MKMIKFLVLLILILSLYNCSTMQLSPADFSWPIESVLEVDEDGIIEEERYSFSVNVKPLFIAEADEDTANIEYKPVRIIRSFDGYYFITAEDFNNVYVFLVREGKMVLKNKIQIKENGMNSPVFNQRAPNIELIDGGNLPVYLNKDGIAEGDQNEN